MLGKVIVSDEISDSSSGDDLFSNQLRSAMRKHLIGESLIGRYKTYLGDVEISTRTEESETYICFAKNPEN